MLFVNVVCPTTLSALTGRHDVNIMKQNAILIRLKRAWFFTNRRLGELELVFVLNIFKFGLVCGMASNWTHAVRTAATLASMT